MTIGHLLEMLGGKASSAKAQYVDGTAFEGVKREDIEEMIRQAGFRDDGKEIFFDGKTGSLAKI